MKKLTTALLALILTVLLTSVAQAGIYRHKRRSTTIVQESENHAVAGGKIDLPHLIGIKQVSPHLFLGLEASKDVIKDPFSKTTRSYFEDDKNYSVYLKLTYNGCIFNCPGK